MNLGYPETFQKLNFPNVALQTFQDKGKWFVFDVIRKKKLVLTPEEWVRQHIVSYLILEKNYPRSLFILERGLKYNHLPKRLDVLVVDRNGNPYLIIECKAPEVPLSQKTLEQVCLYNHSIKAKFLAISNGINHVCLAYSEQDRKFTPMEMFPDFGS